ncbi:hypothetical protein LVJ94_03625 [Pendulispora rubella]|uniref:Carboxypeptidase regulatory-like domain-containing protein n=1 Tax=Pendulispora rubella TaxID=2741070 RepID=A0ABZ2L6D1_9BACT
MRTWSIIAWFGMASMTACASETSTSPSAEQEESELTTNRRSVSMTGAITNLDTKIPVTGVTVDAGFGNHRTVTDAQGAWTISRLPRFLPFTPELSADAFVHITLQEYVLLGDFARGGFELAPLARAQTSRGRLADYDPTKGVQHFTLINRGDCEDPSGGTIVVPPGSSAHVKYFKGGRLSDEPSISAHEDPQVYFYNVDLDKPLEYELVHPTCKLVPFPVKVGNVIYTGKMPVEAGGRLDGPLNGSFSRIFVR